MTDTGIEVERSKVHQDRGDSASGYMKVSISASDYTEALHMVATLSDVVEALNLGGIEAVRRVETGGSSDAAEPDDQPLYLDLDGGNVRTFDMSGSGSGTGTTFETDTPPADSDDTDAGDSASDEDGGSTPTAEPASNGENVPSPSNELPRDVQPDEWRLVFGGDTEASGPNWDVLLHDDGFRYTTDGQSKRSHINDRTRAYWALWMFAAEIERTGEAISSSDIVDRYENVVMGNITPALSVLRRVGLIKSVGPGESPADYTVTPAGVAYLSEFGPPTKFQIPDGLRQFSPNRYMAEE